MSRLGRSPIPSAVHIALLFILFTTFLVPLGVSAHSESPTPPPLTPTPPRPTEVTDTAKANALGQTAQPSLSITYLPMIIQQAMRSPTIPAASSAAPVIIQQSPAPGEELSPDGMLELVFDRPMDQQSVAAALNVYHDVEATSSNASLRQGSAVTGDITWADARTLHFQPDQPLQREAVYRVVLDTTAQDTEQRTLSEAYRFRFETAGYLDISQVIPADGTQDVARDAVITVIFNRPMVPLTIVEEQANLPQPLLFEPALAGEGEWVNTSIYVFKPAQPLADQTTYGVSIDPTLQDVEGNPLRDIYSDVPYTWSFTTELPPALEVVSVSPYDGETLVSVDRALRIGFSQRVDVNAAHNAIRLIATDGSTVPTTLEMPQDDVVVLTPGENLEFQKRYRVEVAAGLQSADGGSPLANPYQSSFQTVPLPRIVATSPEDGAENASPEGFTIYFNTSIKPETVMENITITPPISLTHTSYQSGRPHNGPDGAEFQVHLNVDLQNSTSYTVHIEPDIADRYGNTTGQTLDIHFTTHPPLPVPPNVSLIQPGPVATYSSYRPTRATLQSVNVSEVSLQLYRLQPTDLESHYAWQDDYLPDDATLIRDWQVALDTPPHETVLTRIDLAEDGGSLEPGVYLLVLDPPQSNDPVNLHTLVVSPINLTLKVSERDVLIWANDLATGAPVADLEMDIFGSDGDWLATAATDSTGVAQTRLDRIWNSGIKVVAHEPFAATTSDWNYGIAPWDFGLPSTSNLPEFTTHLYTDRSIYRPDQQVSFKGVLRAEDDVRFSLPVDITDIEVTIQDPTGDILQTERLPVSQHGTFDGEFTLSENAALGSYRIGAKFTTNPGQQEYSATTSFEVAEYRPPEFEVAVSADADEVVRGTPVRATVNVDYFFGSPVVNAPVDWNVTYEPYSFAPTWAGRYTFRDTDDPWYCFSCWWYPQPSPTPLLNGSTTTDAQGRVEITLPAELKNANNEPITDSVRLTIAATATGRDNQVVTNQSEVIVHQSDIYVGLAAQSYVGTAGEEQFVDLLSVTKDEERQPGQRLDIDVYRVTWENEFIEDGSGYGSWTWSEQRTLVHEESVITDEQGQATMSFTPADGGSYRVIATTRDDEGRQSRAALFLWVSDSDYISWRRDNNARINLVSDKQVYTPGETAEILIPSPFQQPHWALITVERGGILSREVQRVESNSLVYRLPLEAEHAPNVFVSVMLFNPPSGSGEPGTEGAADYKVGIIGLEVQPEPQSLRITLTPSDDTVEPGTSLRYEIQVTDHEGNPVSAEFSLDLVDKAVLTLLPRPLNAIKEAFYSLRHLGVTTASGLVVSANRAEDEQQNERPDEDDFAEEPPADLATPEPAIPVEDGEGDRQSSSPPTVREEFADTAYWNARVTTDADGKATIDLALPDNLTTWVMRAVGVTDETYVGEGTVEVIATKPLLIRPVTPRFFVVDDEVELAANVSNRTDEPLQVQVGLTARGITVTTELTKTIMIAPRDEAQVTWQTTVQDVEAVDLVFSAVAGEYSDASKPRLTSGPDGTLPVYRYSAPEVVGTGGELVSADARTEVIALPPRLDTTQGELTVQLEPSLAAGMRDGLEYLEHYPYECTEQTVSRFLPNVLTMRALQQLGITNSELEERLPELVSYGVDRLSTQQNGDGGWGWWPERESNPHVSAYVVFGLLKAREAGFEVRDDVLNRGLEYLTGVAGASDASTLPIPPEQPGVTMLSATSDGPTATLAQQTIDANRQAWLLYVLAEGGRVDGALLTDLYERRATLSHYARAYLAMALHIANPDDERIQTLLSDINSAAILSATGAHWEEQMRDWWSMNTDTRSTAIILHALVRIDPANQLNPNIVRWLMVAREGGIWETTQETAWSLIALTDWMKLTGELQPAYDYGVWLNETEQLTGTMTPDDIMQPVMLKVEIADLLRDVGNQLVIGRGTGAGRLYYTAHLKAYLPVEYIDALDRGVIVQRRYTLASCTDGSACPEVSEVKLGDEVRVELSITAPNNLYYVVIEDPLPAGAEAIDTGAWDESGFWGEWDFYPFYSWWWRWYSRSEFRDEKVVLFADQLHQGSYLYTYTMRATQPGTFHVIPTTASEFYFPEVHGRSDGHVLRISR